MLHETYPFSFVWKNLQPKTLCIPHPCAVFNYRINCPATFINFFGAFSVSCCQIIVAAPLTKWVGKLLDYNLRVACVIGHGFRVFDVNIECLAMFWTSCRTLVWMSIVERKKVKKYLYLSIEFSDIYVDILWVLSSVWFFFFCFWKIVK